jgi:ABC-type glucose/galactose transport system permease subunit
MSRRRIPLEPRERPRCLAGHVNFLKGNPIFVAIASLVVVTSFVEPKFLTTGNFDNIVRQFGC